MELLQKQNFRAPLEEEAVELSSPQSAYRAEPQHTYSNHQSYVSPNMSYGIQTPLPYDANGQPFPYAAYPPVNRLPLPAIPTTNPELYTMSATPHYSSYPDQRQQQQYSPRGIYGSNMYTPWHEGNT